ncbi:hypothetical protein [Pseudoalteromonas sp. SR43-3]|uniref:hypothetical protein n=1 Tax=Pseudoalteromonas sp. SR43-3 TaxID=2760943 RepID=UPI00160047A3|nr:hypothetical protein [Pseudoalteromonas sp. SR43-3]MBB1275946.1 hypothetical protein [Pseudoalteromonas sp. SR43-3]
MIKNNFFLLMLSIYSVIILFVPMEYRVNVLPVSINYIIFSVFIIVNISLASDYIKLYRQLVPMSLIVLLFTLSLVYAPNNYDALVQLISLLLLYFLMLYIFTYFKSNDVVKLIRILFYLGVIYSLASLITVDKLVDYQGHFVGLASNRHNTSLIFGFFCIISFIVLMKSQYFLERLISIFNFFLFQYLIFVTSARVGFFLELVFFLFLLLFLLLVKKNIIVKLAVLSTVIFGLLIMSFYLLEIDEISNYIDSAIKRGSTGRDEINQALSLYQSKYNFIFSVLGFGIGALESHRHLSEHFIRDSNNLTAVVFCIGYIGLILYFLLFASVIKVLIRNINTKSLGNSYLYTSFILSIALIPSETIWLNFNEFVTVFMYLFIAAILKLDSLDIDLK